MSDIEYIKKDERTSEQKSSDVEDASKNFLKAFNDLKASNEQRRIRMRQSHANAVKDESYRTEFFKKALLADTWLIETEAIAYCFCSSLENWPAIQPLYKEQASVIDKLSKSAIGVGLIPVNPIAKEKELRVKPKDYVCWLNSKGLIPYSEILDAIGLSEGKPKKTVNVANAERHAANREAVYRAALAVIVKFPEHCQKNGKFSAAVTARYMEEKSQLLFEDGEVPLTPDTVSRMLNQAFKIFD